jgi:hypothetical protein
MGLARVKVADLHYNGLCYVRGTAAFGRVAVSQYGDHGSLDWPSKVGIERDWLDCGGLGDPHQHDVIGPTPNAGCIIVGMDQGLIHTEKGGACPIDQNPTQQHTLVKGTEAVCGYKEETM